MHNLFPAMLFYLNSQYYVFFQGCPCPLLDVIDVLHPGAALLLFPGIIPRMHVFTRLHLLFLHARPKKAIFLLIIWARSSGIYATNGPHIYIPIVDVEEQETRDIKDRWVINKSGRTLNQNELHSYREV